MEPNTNADEFDVFVKILKNHPVLLEKDKYHGYRCHPDDHVKIRDIHLIQNYKNVSENETKIENKSRPETNRF